MYKTNVISTTKLKQGNTQVNQNVSNPIYKNLPNISEIQEKQDLQYRIVTSIMFWGLGVVAVTLFYKALSSLRL